MNKILSLTLALVLGMTMISTDAFAKRFGGGKSFGKQREQITQPANPAPAAGAAAPAAAPGRSWAGPLVGLAAGGLIGALLFGHGFEGIKAMDILLIAILAGAVFLLLRALRRPQAMQYAGLPQQGLPPVTSGTVATAGGRPAWFEEEPFLRAAKGHFIRLQAAYDRGDLDDIREYTTPEVFAEISLQIQERGQAPNRTEVVQLDAALVDVVTEGNQVLASVRFSGLIREDAEGPAQPFSEIWHIQKSTLDRSAPWFVAGIQQA